MYSCAGAGAKCKEITLRLCISKSERDGFNSIMIELPEWCFSYVASICLMLFMFVSCGRRTAGTYNSYTIVCCCCFYEWISFVN